MSERQFSWMMYEGINLTHWVSTLFKVGWYVCLAVMFFISVYFITLLKWLYGTHADGLKMTGQAIVLREVTPKNISDNSEVSSWNFSLKHMNKVLSGLWTMLGEF